MAIADDIDYDYVNKIMKRKAAAGATVYTVNAAYSYTQTVFDDLGQGDDKIPMGAATPTSYTMDNGWYIQRELLQYMKTGAIETTGYEDEVHTLTLDGSYTNFIDADIGKQVTDDAADVGELLDYDNTAQMIWVRIGSSTVIGDGSAVAINGGSSGGGDASGDSVTGETLIANPYSLGSLFSSLPLYIIQDSTEVTSFWADGHFDILLVVTEAGVDIDSKYITVFGRKWGELYTHYNIQLTSAGQNAVPLGNDNDGNVSTAEGTVETWAHTNISGTGAVYDIDINFDDGNYNYDIGDGNGSQAYDIQVDCNGQTLDKVYEVTKWATRDSSVSQLENYGVADDGQEYISFDTTGNGYAEVVTAPFGTFAGGKFFGARGVYFTNLAASDAQNFELIDAGGTKRYPPNYQAFSMAGLVAGDNVWVYESTGSSSTDVKKDQYSLKVANNVLNELEITVDIPSSTPESGYIIVVDDDGSEIHYAYSAFSGKIFTVSIAADVYTGTEEAYVAFLYANSAAGADVTDTTTIYTAPIDVVGRVRQAGYKRYEAAGTYGSTGFSAIAQRDDDNIYT